MANPSMVANKLEPLRSSDGSGALMKNVVPNATQEGYFGTAGIPAGRVLTLNASEEGELGVTGHRVPMWLFRQSNKPSGGWNGDLSSAATGPTWADGSVHQYLCYVGLPGFEFATTEYDSTKTYTVNTLVTAPVVTGASQAVSDAGKLTTVNASAAAVLLGKDFICGIVSSNTKHRAGGYLPIGSEMLKFYTLYEPAIEGLPNGIAQPTWAV